VFREPTGCSQLIPPFGTLERSFETCCVRVHVYVAMCCSVLQCVAVCRSVLQRVATCCNVVQCVAVYCSVLQCVAVCCSVLQCVAVCCSEDLPSSVHSRARYVGPLRDFLVTTKFSKVSSMVIQSSKSSSEFTFENLCLFKNAPLQSCWLSSQRSDLHLLQCSTLQHTATHCNTLQHTATHCNALQHTATHCNTL